MTGRAFEASILVLSNAVFLLPGIECARRKKYVQAFAYVAVFFTSPLYHACKFGGNDFEDPRGLCLILNYHQYFALDHFFAVLVIPCLCLSLVGFDVVAFDESKRPTVKRNTIATTTTATAATNAKSPSIAGNAERGSGIKIVNRIEFKTNDYEEEEEEEEEDDDDARISVLREVPNVDAPRRRSRICARTKADLKDMVARGMTRATSEERSVASPMFSYEENGGEDGSGAYDREFGRIDEDPSSVDGEWHRRYRSLKSATVKTDMTGTETLYVCVYAYVIGASILVVERPGTAFYACLCASCFATTALWWLYFYYRYGLISKFDGFYLCAGLVLGAFAISLMVAQNFLPERSYWAVHSVWHVMGGLGNWLVLLSKYRYCCFY